MENTIEVLPFLKLAEKRYDLVHFILKFNTRCLA